VPLLAHMGAWGRRFTPATRRLSIRAQLLEEGGPQMWEAFMAELRSVHLGGYPPERSVIRELTDAYLAASEPTSDPPEDQRGPGERESERAPERG
jgi:hypothetical protein